MTTPLSNRRGGHLSNRQAHRLSRRFAEVGVQIPAARLQELATGAAPTENERVDVSFALAVRELCRVDTATKLARARRRGKRWLLVAMMTIVALLSLIAATFLMLSMATHMPPYY